MTIETSLPFLFGVGFLLGMFAIALIVPNPTESQDRTFRIVLGLAASGIATAIPGPLNLELGLPNGTLQSGGAITLFLIVYFLNPLKRFRKGSYVQLSLEEHQKLLKTKNDEIDQNLARSHGEEKDILLKEKAVLEDLASDQDMKDAVTALNEGDESKAKALFQKITENPNASAREAAEAEFHLGNIAKGQIDYTEAFQHFERAVQLQPENSLYLNEAGTLANKLARYDVAIDCFEKALKIDLNTYGPDHPVVAIRWNNLGSVWSELGEYEKAITYHEKALANNLKTYGRDHPSVAIDWNNLGSAWSNLGEYQRAIRFYEKALNAVLKNYGSDHPDVALRWNNLGAAWAKLGENSKAIDYYEKALKSDLKTYGPDHPDVAIDWNNLGSAWSNLGEYQKAIDYFEKALDSDLKTYGSNHPKVAIRWNNLGSALYRNGEYQRAIDYLEKAKPVFMARLGEDHPNTKLCAENLEEAKQALAQETAPKDDGPDDDRDNNED